MKLEMVTEDKNKLESIKEYCKNNNLKFIDKGVSDKEFLFDIKGSKKDLEKFLNDNFKINF